MKTLVKISTVLCVLTLTLSNSRAQESESIPQRPAQFTFIYPLGSNGSDSPDYANNFSLNGLVGVNGGVRGGEIGGLINYNHGDVTGGQIGGVANINRTGTTGAMISGVLNYSGGNTEGFQLSTINVVKEEFTGFQLGVVNLARKMNGVQLGVVNVVEDGEKALPFGIINVVKNGHYELEVTASELLTANLNFKMGVERLYTIYKVGYAANQQDTHFSAGIGLGSMFNIAGKHNVVLDASANQLVNRDTWNENKTSFLAEVDLSYKFRLTEHFSVMAGPTYNLLATDSQAEGELPMVEAPYSFHSWDTSRGKASMWLGFTAGISITL